MYKIQISSQYHSLEFFALGLVAAQKALTELLSVEVWGEEDRKTLLELLYKSWPIRATYGSEEGAYIGWRTGNNKGVLEVTYIKLWE